MKTLLTFSVLALILSTQAQAGIVDDAIDGLGKGKIRSAKEDEKSVVQKVDAGEENLEKAQQKENQD